MQTSSVIARTTENTEMFATYSLVVILASATYSMACLPDCYCGQLGRYHSVMICNNLEWTQIPSKLNNSLEAVDFSNNQIDLLENDDFQGMQNLMSIELQCNNIQSLPTDIFSEAQQLQMIDLSFNSIESLPQELFKYNTHLEKLYLKQNPLSTPSSSAPLLSSSSLSVLDISFCGITELRGVSFSRLKNLKSLNIVGNNISSFHVDAVRPLRGLEQIETSGYELECKDIKVHETIVYLRQHSVAIIPPEMCTNNNLTLINTRSLSKPMPSFPLMKETKNESIIGVDSENKITVYSVTGNYLLEEPHESRELPNFMATGITQAICLLLAALILMAVAITLVNLEKLKNKKAMKKRPPMPLPDRLLREKCMSDGVPVSPHSRTYMTNTGSMHEYAYPTLAAEQHYCEVRTLNDGYEVPRDTADVHLPSRQYWTDTGVRTSMEPLLARPVYNETTVPVPDIIGNVGLMQMANNYLISNLRKPPTPPPWIRSHKIINN